MLDSLLPSLDNSQELTLKLDLESGQSTDLGSRPFLSLDDSQGPASPVAVFDITLSTDHCGVSPPVSSLSA